MLQPIVAVVFSHTANFAVIYVDLVMVNYRITAIHQRAMQLFHLSRIFSGRSGDFSAVIHLVLSTN